MNRITKNQFASLLLITDTFVLFCFKGSISLVTVLGFLTGTAVQFLFSVPAVLMYRNGGTIEGTGKGVKGIYLVYLVLWGGMLFSMLWRTAEVIYIPYESSKGFGGRLMTAVLIALVCLYASSTGIKAISRSAVIASAMGAVCIGVVAVSAVTGYNLGNILTARTDDSFFTELSRGFVLSGGLGSFIVLLGFTKGSPLKNTVFYFVLKLLVTAVVTLATVTVTGGIMSITDFPVVTSAQLSQPFPVQRIDSLFLIIFAVFAVFSITVQSFSGAYLLKEIFPSFRKYRSTAILVSMMSVAFLFFYTEPYSTVYTFAVVAILFLVPVFVLLKRRFADD